MYKRFMAAEGLTIPNSPEIKTYSAGETLGRQYTIGLPPIDVLRKTVPEMIASNPTQILTRVEGMTSEKFQEQIKALRESETVIFDALSQGGLGDSIQSLRYAIIAARHLSDKKFFIAANPQLLDIDRNLLNVPSNVTLTRMEDHVEYNPYSTFLFNSLRTPGRSYFTPRDLNEDRIAWQSPINTEPIMTAYGYKRSSNSIEEDIPFIQTDFQYACWLIGLGIPLTQEDLQSSESSFLHTEIGRQKNYDIVIAPDAKEQSAEGKSEKSLSVANWRKVFENLAQDHPGLRLGIIRGVAHPAYCERVFRAAQRAGIVVTEEVTPTLSDFIHVLQRAKIFVGSDSGTTHLANEFGLADPELNIRELYTYNAENPSYPLNLYGIRGLNQRGRIFRLVRKDKQPTGANLTDATSDIAEFIAA